MQMLVMKRFGLNTQLSWRNCCFQTVRKNIFGPFSIMLIIIQRLLRNPSGQFRKASNAWNVYYPFPDLESSCHMVYGYFTFSSGYSDLGEVQLHQMCLAITSTQHITFSYKIFRWSEIIEHILGLIVVCKTVAREISEKSFEWKSRYAFFDCFLQYKIRKHSKTNRKQLGEQKWCADPFCG